MNWIFDNMQIVIVVASAFAWWLNKRREDAALDEESPSTPKSNEDYAEIERRRKIQEDIRRKIAERRSGSSPTNPQPQSSPRQSRPSPQSTQPVEPAAPEIPPFLRELMGIPDPEPVARRPEPPAMPVVNRQSEMQAEMRRLEATRQEAEAKAANLRRSMPNSNPGSRRTKSGSGGDDRRLLTALRDKKSARRAIILREILDKPIALR
jgi:hypothetical protein